MRNLTNTALLSVIILLTGTLKLPSPFPGGEFQLSAPIAVLICALFGWKRYFLAGLVASLLGLLLGLHNPYSVLIQIAFRAIVASVIALGGVNLLTLSLSGPLGTLFARLLVAQVTGVNWNILAIAALPGMIFTGLVVILAYKPVQRLLGIVQKGGSYHATV
ncbi:hypothetical protein [Phascolarctobacterium sp.]|uniref:hypothetical protein n=1 Tax=Phascolarctobacterium sp. TaxID=2049039 RepID=UPI003867A6E9